MGSASPLGRNRPTESARESELESPLLGFPLLHQFPGFVRIVFLYLICRLRCVLAQISLIHTSLLTHDKGHDPADSVFRGKREQGESVFEFSIGQIALSSAGSASSLPLKQTIKIAVKSAFALALSIALGGRIGHERAHRTRRFPFFDSPIQAVLFTGIAREFGSVDTSRFSISRLF